MNRISQTLHEEHRATIALMERLEALMVRFRKSDGPDVNEPATAQLLNDLATSIESEVQRHFAFEEDKLFSYLSEVGDDAIAEHLTSEHSAIRPVGMALASLAKEARAQGFDAARWAEFRRLGQELTERMIAHVQKEEMALLPLLDDNMQPEVEAQLYESYVENA
jgi:hemerythrin-like domain-containing protein